MTRCIITGPASMLGIALVKECANKGIEVTAVSRPGSERNNLIPSFNGIRVAECGLEEIESLPNLLKGSYDVFFHLGWSHTDKEGRINPELQERNIKYTLDAVKAASKLGCKTFVGAGSQAEYGKISGKVSEKASIAPVMAYGIAKYSTGRISSLLCGKLGIKHMWLRIFSVYGPHNRNDNMITYCMNKLLRGEKPSLTKCEQKWDYLYSMDAAKAFLLAFEKGRNCAVYNVGSGRTKKLSVYVKIMRDAIDPSLSLGFGDIEYPEGQAMKLCADITAFSNDTGFKPETNFKDGIIETIRQAKEAMNCYP
ncbi:MAG: NAD(P)-dependent oxidoreductase [Smithella sp.]|jgi:nucleoside-diphosphate-sugar epimerase